MSSVGWTENKVVITSAHSFAELNLKQQQQQRKQQRTAWTRLSHSVMGMQQLHAISTVLSAYFSPTYMLVSLHLPQRHGYCIMTLGPACSCRCSGLITSLRSAIYTAHSCKLSPQLNERAFSRCPCTADGVQDLCIPRVPLQLAVSTCPGCPVFHCL